MSKPTIKDLQEKLASLGARHAVLQGANEKNIKEIKRLKGSPKVQEQLNMANKTVADLMEQVKDLQINSFNLYTEKEKLKSDYEKLSEHFKEMDMATIRLATENAQLKDDLVNANSDIEKLIKSANEVTAENYALKAEIERINRHINLAENQLDKEQQPIIYNNCTFYNK